MSEASSARWVGLSLGALLIVALVLNAMSRTEASDNASPAPAAVSDPR